MNIIVEGEPAGRKKEGWVQWVPKIKRDRWNWNRIYPYGLEDVRALRYETFFQRDQVHRHAFTRIDLCICSRVVPVPPFRTPELSQRVFRGTESVLAVRTMVSEWSAWNPRFLRFSSSKLRHLVSWSIIISDCLRIHNSWLELVFRFLRFSCVNCDVRCGRMQRRCQTWQKIAKDWRIMTFGVRIYTYC